MNKINKTFSSQYKNAEIEIVVEDDLITTSKVFIDGSCVCYSEIKTDSQPDGVPFTRANYDKVLNLCKADVDKLFSELVEKVTAASSASV